MRGIHANESASSSGRHRGDGRGLFKFEYDRFERDLGAGGDERAIEDVSSRDIPVVDQADDDRNQCVGYIVHFGHVQCGPQ